MQAVHPAEGLLIVDKPEGPTSHDVVARVRRVLGEKRIGHTGTLDPAASGVLSLVIGRATRLAQFMAADDKDYAARVQLGRDTNTYDAEGAAVGAPFDGPWPSRETVEAAVSSFRGTFPQTPPAYSAKKIAGKRAYTLARGSRGEADRPAPVPEPVSVTLSDVEVTGYEQGLVDLQLTCSAGFYVRSLAYDLGQRLGTGAHLAALRRTRCGAEKVADAWALADIEADPAAALGGVIPMASMLPGLPTVLLAEAGIKKVSHGQSVGPEDLAPESVAVATRFLNPMAPVKLISGAGALLAIARVIAGGPPGVLHPSVVLM